MIRKFEVMGFKNFETKVTFDFSDVSDYKFNSDCIENNIISKAIVYGKNSIGKSNLGLAIFDIVSSLTDKNVTPNLYDYYLTAGNTLGYAEFHYVFDLKGNTVDYIYRKNAKRKLIYEKVDVNENNLYECSGRDITVNSLVDYAPTLNVDADLETMSFLKYIVSNALLPDDNPLKLLVSYVSHMLWFRNLDENRYIGYTSDTNDYYNLITEESVAFEFQEFLRKAGMNDNLRIIDEADGRKKLYLDTTPPLPFFGVASNGTKALYTLFYWLKNAPEVSFMFIDEFDAYYHYELSEILVKMLEQIKGVQVVLTSHNTNLLSNKIMRPDCYFVLTKNKLTALKNATDRELREGHNLEKLYMSGEFGEK